jgi:2'-5' RNA ligase superfamily
VPAIGTTALVIEVPGAEALLDVARRVNPALVRPGLPAHVTVLYPFLPVAELTDDVDAAVRAIAASVTVTEVRLTELVSALGFVAMAAPELQPVADAAYAEWPGVQPYGGRFGPKPPVHLTIAMGGTEDELAQVVAQTREAIPVIDQPEAVHLVVLTEQGWQLRLSAPLGSAGGTTAR